MWLGAVLLLVTTFGTLQAQNTSPIPWDLPINGTLHASVRKGDTLFIGGNFAPLSIGGTSIVRIDTSTAETFPFAQTNGAVLFLYRMALTVGIWAAGSIP
jgi:hypothetical protein